MRLKEKCIRGFDVFAISGEIDLHYAPIMRSLLKGKVNRRCPALILDFSDVEYLDSSGIAALLEYRRDAADYGGVICVAALKAGVRAIFETVRLDTVFNVYGNVDEAIAALGREEVKAPAAVAVPQSDAVTG